MGVITYLVKRMKSTESRRVKYFHMAEYSNKMATIGRLAAGVAHEINNPLAIINEKAGLISDIFQYSKEYQQNQKLKETINSIIISVERCSRITRQLLSFARHLNLSIQTIRLDEVVKEVLGFLHKEAQYRSIEVLIDIAEDIPEFECDRGKLQQILLNIINNAFAALTNGGQIKIKSDKEGPDSVKIVISDNGCGIPAENLKYIFEPFFSTRMKVGGTGLGLSITYGLIQELGGKIDVKSEVGKGSRFTITLPLTPKKEDPNHEYTPG
jgi:signal transduction histidine kinase